MDAKMNEWRVMERGSLQRRQCLSERDIKVLHFSHCSLGKCQITSDFMWGNWWIVHYDYVINFMTSCCPELWLSDWVTVFWSGYWVILSWETAPDTFNFPCRIQSVSLLKCLSKLDSHWIQFWLQLWYSDWHNWVHLIYVLSRDCQVAVGTVVSFLPYVKWYVCKWRGLIFSALYRKIKICSWKSYQK